MDEQRDGYLWLYYVGWIICVVSVFPPHRLNGEQHTHTQNTERTIVNEMIYERLIQYRCGKDDDLCNGKCWSAQLSLTCPLQHD